LVKLDIYECDRCHENIEVPSDEKPITVEHVDGRFVHEEKETLHLCGDCYLTFLYAIEDVKERREAFDKLAEKFSKMDKKEEESKVEYRGFVGTNGNGSS